MLAARVCRHRLLTEKTIHHNLASTAGILPKVVLQQKLGIRVTNSPPRDWAARDIHFGAAVSPIGGLRVRHPPIGGPLNGDFRLVAQANRFVSFLPAFPGDNQPASQPVSQSASQPASGRPEIGPFQRAARRRARSAGCQAEGEVAERDRDRGAAAAAGARGESRLA